jgi:hypothetical protein
MIARAACLLAAVLVTGCRPSEPDCDRLLDHFLDVEGAAATDGRFTEMTEPLKEALAARKREFHDSLHHRFVGKCQEQLSRSEVDCALRANDPASMDRCEER